MNAAKKTQPTHAVAVVGCTPWWTGCAGTAPSAGIACDMVAAFLVRPGLQIRPGRRAGASSRAGETLLQELGTPAWSFSSTRSMLKLGGSCRAGNSANDEIIRETYTCAGMGSHAWSRHQS